MRNKNLYIMIRTIVKPQSEQIRLTIPKEYVGKKVEITYLLLDELPKLSKSMKDFWGTLSDESAVKFHEYVRQSRNE